ncbi:MAG: nucleotide exchange factor GrpE [Patescibacteria group bacterium]|nr:nucleotide exchange factor GrpE [Patescibacteria group bacterium]
MTDELKKKSEKYQKDDNPPATHTPSLSEELKKLQEKLQECQKLKDEYLAGWQRERAEFLNYKKEEMERVGDLIKYAGTGFILNLLPILDNFEIAQKKLPENLKNDENVKGLLLIKNQLQDFLKSQGVEEIKTIGEKFNPNFQEVVEEIEKPDADSGIVIEEIQKGYKIHGRLLRPAKVKIAK